MNDQTGQPVAVSIEIDEAAAVLRRDGENVAVEPQVFELIAHLARNAGRLVTRDELTAAVWGGRIVSDSVISTRINAARRALGDDGTAQRIIKTVHGRGFRYLLPAGPAPDEAAARDTVSSTASIAILPFENLSPDPAHGFFGDGLAEEIITTLSKISNIFVIARQSSFSYRGRAVDVRDVGRELGVRHVLEGSVRAAGGRIRVTAQLIDAADGRHIWAERYERQLDDIFAIQDEIARRIVTALHVRLSDGEQWQIFLHGTTSVEAWSLMMNAVDLWRTAPLPSGHRDALVLLSRALEIDPDYASAHGMVAQIHWANVHHGFTDDVTGSMARCRSAMERAVAIDPKLALAYTAAAELHAQDGDFTAARDACRVAINLAPNSGEIRSIACRSLIDAGCPEEAESNMRYAMRLNPFHPVWYVGVLANALEQLGREEEAIAILKPCVDANQDYFAGNLRLASLLGLAGRPNDARRYAEEAHRLNPRFNRSSIPYFYCGPDEAKAARFLDGLEKAGMPL